MALLEVRIMGSQDPNLGESLSPGSGNHIVMMPSQARCKAELYRSQA